MQLTSEEIKRYGRHLVLEEFGMARQVKLKKSSVLVIGAGGLGCPALMYLAAAGVGSIGIVDNDTIDISNLQRQILYSTHDIGQLKADVAVNRLKALNPLITVTAYPVRLTAQNALDIIRSYDVVIDGSDNFPTRYLVNDACVLLDKPMIYGSILKFEGQVAVFNFQNSDGTFSSNYRDLFPLPPDPDEVPNCEQAGVIGVLPGLTGTMQANEAIKILTSYGTPLTDKLLIIDADTASQTIIKIKNHQARKAITGLIDYDLFCSKSPGKNKSLEPDFNTTQMKEITVEELKALQDSGADFQLIDVREPHEADICTLGGELIPMSQVPANIAKIDKNKQVVVYCRSGRRSADSIIWLERNHQYTNLYNLKGGILAWARDIDPDMPTY